jgi:phage tail sheath protein FI
MAGVIARTDNDRGVWKAPAGTEATLEGAAPKFGMNDVQTGVLNQLGINCLRSFPAYGPVSWGARTLQGADALASEWKYVPVRRTALYIENTVSEGTRWVVFEPNDEPLWSQLRMSVGTFMHDLFRQGAFAGSKPEEAYFVSCDRTTTTQGDIDRGIVHITVGFAPLKPAEFIVLNIEQHAGS